MVGREHAWIDTMWAGFERCMICMPHAFPLCCGCSTCCLCAHTPAACPTLQQAVAASCRHVKQVLLPVPAGLQHAPQPA
jgi:hypothetical protein